MKYFVVDAFTDSLFAGNPAGVALLEHPLDDATMQAIATENNLSETAFLLPAEHGYDLRWFTPAVEVDLCGHATLGSAFVLHKFGDAPGDRIDFFTKSGTLTARFDGDLISLDLPARPPMPIELTADFATAVGCEVTEAYLSRDLLLLAKDAQAVRNAKPDFAALAELPVGFGVILTATGDDCDFVSRFFVPKGGVDEDPVTGSSHSTLVPFWSGRLGKQTMVAHQVSARGGVLYCQMRGDRVGIAGRAVLYMAGQIEF